MKKRFFSVLIAIALSLSGFTLRSFAVPQNSHGLSVSARSAALLDLDSGSLLYEKNADERLGMASTTKIMTALVAAEEGKLDRVISIPKEAVGIEGSSIYLTEGESLTLRQLLYALLLSSANDAAVAIAIAVSGSVESFVELMNEKALSLGLKSTHFTNPHGLYDDDHYTTAYELALISAEALNDPVIREIASTYKRSIPKGEDKCGRVLVNHNKMLRLYDGAIGLKTGFTKKTGRCLVSAAERDGLTLIAVTLNAPDDWNDHCSMLDLGFKNYERVTVYEAGDFSYALPLTNGKENYVLLTNAESISFTLPKSRKKATVKVYTLRHFEFAPIKEGATLGRLVCEAEGMTADSRLIAAYGVDSRANQKKGFFEKIADFFSKLFS